MKKNEKELALATDLLHAQRRIANELRRDMAGTMAALEAERAKVRQLEAEKAALQDKYDALHRWQTAMLVAIRHAEGEVQRED